jgi:HlyD family secretion protein
LAIPESVLQFDKEKPFVEIQNKAGKYDKKQIKTGLSDGINIEVTEGISITDKIKVPQVNEPTTAS